MNVLAFFVMLLGLAVLAVVGGVNGHGWLRIVLYAVAVLVLMGTAALAVFFYALGQAFKGG